MASRLGGFARKIAYHHHLPPGEGAVPVLIAGLGECFGQERVTDYPARQVAHGGFWRWHRENVAGKFLFDHDSKMF